MNYNNASDNIDNIAQSFFFVLIFCSLVSDSYIVFDNFLKNNYVKKKVGFLKKIYKITINLFCNNYEKDNDGNIIINKLTENVNKKVKKNNTLLKINNPFDDIYKELEEIKEIVENVINEDSVNEGSVNEGSVNEGSVINEEHNIENHDNEEHNIENHDNEEHNIKNHDNEEHNIENHDNEEYNTENHNNEDDFKETIVKEYVVKEFVVKEDKEINNIKIKEKKIKKNKKNIDDDNYLIDKIKNKNIKEVIKKKN
jgi:hypothetical protein